MNKSDPAIVDRVYRDYQGLFWKVTEITEPHKSVVAEARDGRIRDRSFLTALEWSKARMTEFDVDAFAQFAGFRLIPFDTDFTVKALVVAAHKSKLGAMTIRPAEVRNLVERLALS